MIKSIFSSSACCNLFVVFLFRNLFVVFSATQIKSGHSFRSLAGILSGPAAFDLESFDKSE